MHEIDFLPSELRKNRDRQRWYDRRILVVTGLAALIAAAAWSQRYRAERLEAELASRQPGCTVALEIRETLDELQSQLQLARTRAELITYFRHPWPRTQILAALVAPLSPDVRFEELEIKCQAPEGAEPAKRRFPAAQEEEKAKLAAMAPPERDLSRLRDQCDSRQTVVTITGVTGNSAALYQYVGALDEDDLFAEVRLGPMGVDRSDPTSTRFRVTLVVRPGYGQPGGPGEADPPRPEAGRSENHLARR